MRKIGGFVFLLMLLTFLHTLDNKAEGNTDIKFEIDNAINSEEYGLAKQIVDMNRSDKSIVEHFQEEMFKKINGKIKEQDFEKAKELARYLSDEKKQDVLSAINDKQAEEFWSIWGVGLVINFDLGDKTPVKNASVINGVVRVEKEDDVKYGLGLEIHRFLWGMTWGWHNTASWKGGIAMGPYVSVLPSANEVLDVIGTGLIFGFHGAKSNADEKDSMSLNIAIGGYADPDTRVLASGFEDGKAPPAGETNIRFKDQTQYGVQGVVSFSYVF